MQLFKTVSAALIAPAMLALGSPALAQSDADSAAPSSTTSNPAAIQELPAGMMIGTSPLPALGIPLNQMPANLQTAGRNEIGHQHALDLVDFMNQNLNGVNINETQDNSFQADVNFSEFTASLLLGTPEELSVYMDIVRLNESFGDVINGDLILESTIANLSLMPGSYPNFCLNTLGGALTIQTKSGKQFHGTSIDASGDSFGSRALGFETVGIFADGFDYPHQQLFR